MEDKMSRWGIGPIFAGLSIGYGMIMLAISWYYRPKFQMDFLPYRLLSATGIALIVIGIPFYFMSVKSVMRAYNADELVTGGFFRCCRHPIYASWVVFLIPGIVLLVNSWICLTIPIFMYIVVRLLVKKEEIYLESVFGSEYRNYKNRVPCILPYGFMTINANNYRHKTRERQ
jgi:protein-S-isoprenylcysteine O-methyltransferase Ste14